MALVSPALRGKRRAAVTVSDPARRTARTPAARAQRVGRRCGSTFVSWSSGISSAMVGCDELALATEWAAVAWFLLPEFRG
jgi:hypothetical protein